MEIPEEISWRNELFGKLVKKTGIFVNGNPKELSERNLIEILEEIPGKHLGKVH